MLVLAIIILFLSKSFDKNKIAKYSLHIKDKILFLFIKLNYVWIFTFFLKSFGLFLLLPLVFSFINCGLFYLKMEYLGVKKPIKLYIFYLLFGLIIYIIGGYINLGYFIQVFLLSSIPTYTIESCTCRLLPEVADEHFGGRSKVEFDKVENLDPTDWSIKDKLRIANRLTSEFNKGSHDFSKGDVALFRHILKKEGVQENWVIKPVSTTNKIKMYTAIKDPANQAMVREYIEQLNNIDNAFTVGNKRILN